MATQPIRICYFIDELNEAGTEIRLLSLIRNLDKKQVQPFLCLLRGRNPDIIKLEPYCCPVIRLQIDSIFHPMAIIKLARFAFFLWYYRISVLQMYFPDSTLVGIIIGWLVRVPFLVRTRNNLGYSLTDLQKKINKIFQFIPHVTIANCPACRDSLIAEENGQMPVIVIDNGVDLGRFPISSRKSTGVAVGMVANLRPVKNPGLFLQAALLVFKEFPDVLFSIAGDGPQRKIIELAISEYRIADQFSLLGRVKDIPNFLSQIDIAVLCSSSEGLSNAVLEYMAAGKAIVATSVGGNNYLIENGVNGLLVPTNDPFALAQTILSLIRNEKLRCRLGKSAKDFVRQRFCQIQIVEKYQTFYRNLINNQQSFH